MMEQATLDYFDTIIVEVGTTVSTWSKSDVRYHPVVVNARRTDTAPYKYKANQLEAIQKIWDERRYKRGKG